MYFKKILTKATNRSEFKYFTTKKSKGKQNLSSFFQSPLTFEAGLKLLSGLNLNSIDYITNLLQGHSKVEFSYICHGSTDSHKKTTLFNVGKSKLPDYSIHQD